MFLSMRDNTFPFVAEDDYSCLFLHKSSSQEM